MVKLATFLVVFVLLAIAQVETLLAIVNPDSIVISSVRGYRSLEVDGDLLVVAIYEINYTVNPDESIQDAYIARFMDGTTELDTASLYPFIIPNIGYDKGFFAFYFEVEPSPTTGFEAVIQGNPGLFPSSTGNKASNAGIDFRTGSTVLTLDLIIQGLLLESKWLQTDPDANVVEATPEGNRLTVQGDEYYANTIPKIRQLAPGLFTGSVIVPIILEDTFTNSYTDQIRDYWVGTSFDSAMSGLSTWLDTPKIIISTAMLVLVASGIAFYIVLATQRSEMGLMAGSVVMIVGALVGWTPYEFVAILGLVGVLAVGYIFFYQKSTS